MSSVSRSAQEYNNPLNNLIKETNQTKSNITIKKYISSLTCEEVANRITYILTTTGLGAGIGAAVGASGCGMGAAPGAGIGAAVGFTFGVATSTTLDACKFTKWKKSQNQETVHKLVTKLTDLTDNKEFICPISKLPIFDPVLTPYTEKVYDRKFLQEWIIKYGTDPFTNQPLTVGQLRHAAHVMGGMNKFCKSIINEEAKNMYLDQKEMDGVKALQEDFDTNIRKLFFIEKDLYAEKVKNKEISIQEFVAQMKKYADAVEPTGQ